MSPGWQALRVSGRVCRTASITGSLISWSERESPRAERTGDMICQQPQGQALGSDATGARPEAGLPSTLQETPESLKGSGDKASGWTGNCGLRKSLCPRIEGGAGVPVTLSVSLRLLSHSRNPFTTGSSVQRGQVLAWPQEQGCWGQVVGQRGELCPSWGRFGIVAKAEADRKRERGDCSLGKEAG